MKFEYTNTSNFENALRGMRNPLASWKRSDSEFGISDLDDCLDYVVSERWTNKLYPDIGKDSDEWYDRDDEIARWLRDNGVLRDYNNFAIVEYVFIGPNDMDLAMRLCDAGPEHRKFLRQIQVCVDITAPLYWWKEFDTYKVGTTANSTSTMHKLASTPITMACFETGDYQSDLILAEDGDMKYSVGGFVSTDGIDYTLIAFLEGLRQKYNETKDKRYWKELVRWLPNGWLQTRTVTMNYENLRSMCHQREGHKLVEWHDFIRWARTLPYAEQFIFGQPVAF